MRKSPQMHAQELMCALNGATLSEIEIEEWIDQALACIRELRPIAEDYKNHLDERRNAAALRNKLIDLLGLAVGTLLKIVRSGQAETSGAAKRLDAFWKM